MILPCCRAYPRRDQKMRERKRIINLVGLPRLPGPDRAGRWRALDWIGARIGPPRSQSALTNALRTTKGTGVGAEIEVAAQIADHIGSPNAGIGRPMAVSVILRAYDVR
jgi:hypothetical protein